MEIILHSHKERERESLLLSYAYKTVKYLDSFPLYRDSEQTNGRKHDFIRIEIRSNSPEQCRLIRAKRI